MKGFIVIAIILCLFGCSDDDINSSDSTVHLAGFLSTSDGAGVASYWKDGKYTDLTHDSIRMGV
jgi:hypothetical protein